MEIVLIEAVAIEDVAEVGNGRLEFTNLFCGLFEHF